MNALQQFLVENDVRGATETFRLNSPRLKEFDFTVSAMSTQQYNGYQTKSMSGKGKNTTFMPSKFNMAVIVNHCVEPNFRDAAFIQACGVSTPEECVNRTLRAGEVQQLSEKILEISGFGEGAVEEEMDEVKNS